MTPHVLKAAAWAAYSAVLALGYNRLRRTRGGEIGLYDRIPRWYVALVVAATIGLIFAIIAANSFGRR